MKSSEYIKIMPGIIEGSIKAPTSKSAMQRVLAMCCLSDKEIEIRHNSTCDDIETAIAIIQRLGCAIERSKGTVIIRPKVLPHDPLIECNESGLCMRLFPPVVSVFSKTYTLSAKGTLIDRPVGFMQSPLIALGAKIKTSNGLPPVKIKGPLSGGGITVDGSLTSQFITGLLIALPAIKNDSVINVINPKSKPYIELTLSMLKSFNIKVENEYDFSKFFIAGRQAYTPVSRTMTIEGDWSSVSFFLVAGAVSGNITIDNIDLSSNQADRKIIEVLQNAGANVEIENNRIMVSKKDLNCFDFDASDCPDLFPPLTALAINCKGVSRIYGTDRLRHKESDRKMSLIDSFSKAGANITQRGNYLEIRGGKLEGGTADSHNDHRIAMALAVAALASKYGIIIHNYKAVSKSYPEFFNELNKVRKDS